MITLSVANDSSSSSVTLAQQEMYLLRNLLGVSIPTLTGWQYQLSPSTFDPTVNLAAPSRAAAGGPGTDVDEIDQGGAPQANTSYGSRPPYRR